MNVYNKIRDGVRGNMKIVLCTLGLCLSMNACTADNRLPQTSVPKLEVQETLPSWYPERAWLIKHQDRQIVEGKIVFESNQSYISSEAEKVLEKLLGFLVEHPEISRLRVEGHTDSRAGDEKNQTLGGQRAQAVCNWLVDHGVETSRLIAVSFGESKPLATNDVKEGMSENRRSAFFVAELKGRPFMGKDPYAGGSSLIILSKEDRKLALELEQASQKPMKTAPKPTVHPTGNEIKIFDPFQQAIREKKTKG